MREVLEKELDRLVNDLKVLGIHNPKVKEDWIATPEEASKSEADPNVVADRVEDWEERRATIAILEKEYNNIIRALKKIEDGKYGACEICGEDIEEDRLKSNPSARTCKKHINNEMELAQ